MQDTRALGFLSLLTLLLTVLWVVFLSWEQIEAGPLETPEQIVAYVVHAPLYTVSYANAALLTLVNTFLIAGLAHVFRQRAPLWMAMGAVFVPIYGSLNLFAYLSQIMVVPHLAGLAATGADPTVTALLFMMIHTAPGSVTGFVNGLAYTVLGIPLAVLGVILLREGSWLRAAGWLFLLTALADLVGFVGDMVGSKPLGVGILIGGGIYLLALIPLTVGIWRTSVDSHFC